MSEKKAPQGRYAGVKSFIDCVEASKNLLWLCLGQLISESQKWESQTACFFASWSVNFGEGENMAPALGEAEIINRRVDPKACHSGAEC